ncbi:GTP-binding protein Era [Oleidesulfovibrio alaskensis G20]|jgi:GTP-binding protein Era|uniref:GTPase Era n=1 Tax=Oleidesulfovibrio alaskensis (strain ATCC BAA-1058 / DSM 17464 / G20) TaxID=207559 RepID=Q30VB2_OLEA2|nr:GTPase Era [Oleidesulfovibrio alaskensis]ABB40384.1 GTP-binding protein Era [Oleidesulfovibrio alaskensis G20]MBG0772650.1 GTPase Era [Oleidesulfovibrio alaskensis]MBL3581919.1 GTPase Era [Oleidesulfovibrio alaskensis]
MTHSSEHRCGWVALMGPPNAGKSTMMNSLLGQKVAIVTPKPQTTRNQIVGILTQPDAQVVFMDTPGIHQLRGKMNRLLLQAAWQSMDGADVIMVVLDSNLYVRKPDFLDNDIEPLIEVIRHEKRPVVVALNKVDMFADKSRMLPLLEKLAEMWPAAEIFPVSALNDDGLRQMLAFIKGHLPVADPVFPDDQVSTAPLRFMAAEIIREKLFLELRQELPYNSAVSVEKWEDLEEEGRVVIHAVIHVARKNHKGMVIGRQGQTLKKIGTDARKEIEALVDRKVFLDLWVRVTDDWMDNEQFMVEIGMGAR